MRRWTVIVGLAALVGCADPAEQDEDAGQPDAAADAAAADVGPVDLGLADAGAEDTGFLEDAAAMDAAAVDATPDAGSPDATPMDAAPEDAGFPDAAPPDTGPPDTGPPDTGPPDLGVRDAGFPDAAPTDTGPVGVPDVGFPDAAPPDTGPVDTGPVDTGLVDSGVPDSGPADAGVVDAGPMTCTVTPNSCPNQEVCLGEQCSCILAMHGDHYLRTDGTVVYWGASTPTVITTTTGATLTGITEIYSGSGHACALESTGTVWCWPFSFLGNRNGQLGKGITQSNVPSSEYFEATRVLTGPGTPLTGAQSINGGASRSSVASNSCAITTGGNLYCWGAPDASGGGGGSLFNDGVPGNRPYATPILAAANTPLTGVTAVSLGARHACVIRTGSVSGEVWCWGANVAGPLGQGNQTAQTYPVQVTLPAAADQVGAGFDVTCARLGPDVYCWGYNNSGQVGIGPRNAPGNHDGCINFCKLTPARVVDAAGAPLTNVVALDVAYLAVCARRADHSLWCWGNAASNASTDWAVPATIGTTTLSNVARFTTSGSSGYRAGLRYLNRDATLFRSSISQTPLCP